MLLAATFALLAQAAVPATPVPEAAARPAPAGPYLVMETSLGRIRIGLYKDKAPGTVDNFVQYVRGGHYDGTIFHRVIPNFMAQGGGFEPDMTERPTRPPIKNEARNGLRNLRRILLGGGNEIDVEPALGQRAQRSIKRMLAAGLIEECDERPDPALDDERRRYYRLSGLGQRVLAAEAERLSRQVMVARLKHVLNIT